MKNRSITKLVVLALLALMPGVEMFAQDWKSILEGVASSVGEKVSEKVGEKVDIFTVEGRWAYVKPECKLESENVLTQTTGEIAANRLEDKAAELMAKLGFTENSVFTFNNDSTYSLTNGTRTLTGTYSLNKETKEITMTPRFGRGFTAKVVKNVLTPNKMNILFKTDKLMAFAKNVSGALAKKSPSKTASIVDGLLQNYDGAMFGFELENLDRKKK